MTEQLLLTEGVDPQSPTSDDADEIGIKDDVLPLRDKDLPPIVREIVTNAPPSRKLPAFVACLAPL